MHTTVCLFGHRAIATPVVESLLRDVASRAYGAEAAIQVAAGDAAIDRHRSKRASEFLATMSDVLVMIDEDIHWSPGDVARLAAHAFKARGIVGGLVSKRAFGKGLGGRPPEGYRWELGKDELHALPEHSYVGGAFTAIHRDVIAAVAEGMPAVFDGDRPRWHPVFLPMVVEHPDHGLEYLSEDWAFCYRARRAGFPVYAATGPWLTHIGTHGYTLHDATGAR